MAYQGDKEAMAANSTAYEVPSPYVAPATPAPYPQQYDHQYDQHVPAVQINAQGQPYSPAAPKGPMRLKGYMHLLDAYTVFKWQHPKFYRKPGFGYEKLSQHRHLDWFDREWTGDYDDRYISSYDGKISKLVVQAVDDIYDNTTNSTWRRTFIRNIAPLYLRLANWPFNHVDYVRNGGPTSEDWPMICAKWFVASIAITFVIGSPTAAEGQVRNQGMYDPFPYKYQGYTKVSRNGLELETPSASNALSTTNPIAERVLRPRYLCFLQSQQGAELRNVEEWMSQFKDERSPSYVFVAYTGEQFQTRDDLAALLQIAEQAARREGVDAYWIGCSCLPEQDKLQEDVYRICDVIRGAHSVAIAVARPPNDMYNISTTDLMLQQWGRRIWTFPEVLLAPAGRVINVYTRGTDLSSPLEIPKNQFAARVWKDDALVARQLIDHYEGSLILSQLELVTLALECLHARQTTQYLSGDHSYALMGLLRIRPQIDPTDSAFQAFARLSLANNSDALLERLICVLPSTPSQPWYSMSDAYGAKLWDILPQETSIAGIGHDDTILLDGCKAANVRWKSFSPVAHDRIFSWKRWLAQTLLHLGGVTFLIAIIFLAMSAFSPAMLVPGVLLIVYSIILMGLSPYLLRLLYLGKFWGTQGWFFGFEGYMDIDTIERQIFGARLGRMKWTPYGSPLSRHVKNAHGDCVPVDPCTDPETRAMVERAKGAKIGEQRVFTLIDTGTMTATLFVAARPPVCFLLAGSEGGMQRAIGCSYDWSTSTLYRETVLRMETPIVDKVFRVPRVKVGFNRGLYPVRGLSEVGEAIGGLRN